MTDPTQISGGGLIAATNPDGTAPKDGQAAGTGYTPSKWTVDPNQTTSGQMAQILDPNSQLMTQAAAQGNEQANARGLVNSTMGISAAQDSMIKAATPIATSTAKTYADAGQTNAGAENAALQYTAGANNAASIQNAQDYTSITNNKANNETTIQNTQLQQQTSAANNASTQANAAMKDYNDNMAAIGQNTNLDAGAKQTLYDNARAALNQQLAAIGAIGGVNPALASLNLGQYFQAPVSAAPAPAAPAQNYTAPDGSIWASQDAYNQTHPAYSSSLGDNGVYGNA